jgi:SMC interacting uncharacterized protein involved in chromosome segregation
MEYKINFPKYKEIIKVKLINRQLSFYDDIITRRLYICDLTDEDIKTNIQVDNKVESFIKILDNENIKFERDGNFEMVLKYISGNLIMWVKCYDRKEKELKDLINDLELVGEDKESENRMLKTNVSELRILIDKLTDEKETFKIQNEALQNEALQKELDFITK